MENNQTAPEQAQDKPKKSRQISLKLVGFLVLMLLLILALLAVGWWSYQHHLKLQQLEVELTELSDLQGTTKSLKRSLDSGLSSLRNDQRKQVEMLQRQQDAISELQQKSPLSSAEIEFKWALAEVEYLLGLANQRATLANDPAGAVAALQLADDVLQEADDYQLQPLRELLAEQTLALEGLTKIDLAGLAADMQSAIIAIDGLRVVRGPRLERDPMADTGADISSGQDWRDAVDAIWQQVRSLVVIRELSGAPEAVLMPEQRYFLYQNLKLKLETARFALLSGNQSVFESSLDAAIEWLELYFTGESRDALLNRLKVMQAEAIVVEIPDISESLRWLQRFES